ncbi:hypothetical protein V8G54_023284 [Vigna mungo]|uniref:Uncharacterized protein n=1 Tax=Vigna mungo TaxID=3915 RepID=A0AAQ3RRF4_VIGMU
MPSSREEPNNWSDPPDQSGVEGSRNCWIIKGGLPNLLRRGLPDQEGIKNMEGRNNTLERRTNGQKMSMAELKMSMVESKMNMAEYRRNMQEIREMLQEIKIHIKDLGRSEESIMKGQKEGSDEEEMEEDKGEQNWRQRVELARFEGLDPLGWISQAEKFFDTQNIKEKERLRRHNLLVQGWKNKTKNLSWKGLKEALIMGFGGRDRGSVFEKKRETEAAAVLSVDGFARIRGQDRREENIRGEEGNAANGDGDMGVTAAGKVEKATDFTAANCDGDMGVTAAGKVEKAADFTAADKVEKAVVSTAAEKVVAAEKVAVFSEDSVVGCGVNVKTVKTGKKRSGGRENASNWEQKGEDATDNNGARKGEETTIFSWVKREELITYEGIDKQDQTTGAANAFKVQNTEGSTKAHPNSKENVVQGCKTWHQKFKHLSWKNLAPTLLKIVEGNKRSNLCENWAASLQVDGAAAKSVVATKADEVRVEILKTSQNWAKRIQEELMKRSHEIKPSISNLEDKGKWVRASINRGSVTRQEIFEYFVVESSILFAERGYALIQGGYAPILRWHPPVMDKNMGTKRKGMDSFNQHFAVVYEDNRRRRLSSTRAMQCMAGRGGERSSGTGGVGCRVERRTRSSVASGGRHRNVREQRLMVTNFSGQLLTWKNSARRWWTVANGVGQWQMVSNSCGQQLGISGSQGTGTFRSVSRPPQFRDKKTEVSNHQLTQKKSPESGYQVGSGNKNELLEASFGKDSGIPYHDEHLDNHLEDDELYGNGLGTVVVRSPKGPQSSLFRDQSSRSSSSYASFEDVSTSGTVVLRNQHDDSDSPQTPRSRLGLNNRNSNASFEDSATNLAEAKAAIQGGLRKVNVRDRFALGKLNNDVQESRRDQMSTSSDSSRYFHCHIAGVLPSREYMDAQKGISRSQYYIDDEESAKIISSSAPLSVLLIPSLKEAIAEDPEGPIVQIIINALLNMERTKPQSCDALVKNLLQRLASSKELSLKDLQELAGRLLSKTKSVEEARNAETDLKKKQNKEIHSNSNLSPLARFLLSRFVEAIIYSDLFYI